MGRAENRRAKKEQLKGQATYTFTRGQLTDYVRRESERYFERRIEPIKQDITDAAVNTSLELLFVLSCEVLMDHFWVKSYARMIPKFVDHLIDYYTKWQNGELDMEAMRRDLWEYGGIRFQADTIEESEDSGKKEERY